ncbi:hypothetical protein [Agrobacterium tumefaciens]|uniref:Uncharacterized protein n=1 Tax=Agrobacterium tumefaciens TaxID=358 RepID=A0AA44FA82_AGRTU|nr:hypothetical protein [Agrobacterium tumefaciens]NTB87735.1 hypothetical protein [Agrobacterium tumefaciens]NTC32042.1 hypothetical protein [Agrobacterium tumefaciens]
MIARGGSENGAFHYKNALEPILSKGEQSYWLSRRDHQVVPVEDFLQSNIAAEAAHNPSVTVGRRLLAETVSQHTGAPFHGVLDSLQCCPAIFTGPHSSLCLSVSTFVSRCLAAKAASTRTCSWGFAYECSTVSLQSKNGVGPGWLEYKGTRHNVFGVSRQTRDSAVVCARHGSWTFRSLADSPHLEMQEIAARISAIEGTSPENAFKQANETLCLTATEKTSGVLAFADSGTASLIARHLAIDGVLSRLLLEKDLRQRLVKEIGIRASLTPRLLPNSTDFFWFISEGCRHAARISGSRLENKRLNLSISFSRDELIENLIEGRIIPNLFLTFMAICILPNLTCFGGHRQMIYIPLFKASVAAALQFEAGSDAELQGESVWLPDVLQPVAHPVSMIAAASKPLLLTGALLAPTFQKDGLGKTRLDYLDPEWYAEIKSGHHHRL